MRIRNKLTLLFTAMIAALLLLFAFVVYFSFSENREDEYYKLIRQQATTKANLLFDAKVSPNVLQLIYKNSPNSLFQEEVAIYDTSFDLLYHDAVEIDKVKETKEMINEIVTKNEIRFNQQAVQVVGFLYSKNNRQYVITAAAQDRAGLDRLSNLKYTLIIAFILSVIFIFIGGRFFSKKAFQPVSKLVDNVNEITATNLDLRIDEGNGKDELAELAVTFNKMLNRLEYSFDTQKQFVSNISHELRTPLAAMIAELDLASNKERTIEEYKTVVDLSLSDAKKLVRLINGLLDLAKASYDQSEITFKELRLDELLLDARQQLIAANPEYNVQLSFEKEIENDDYISIEGNEYLLKTAFTNLMENGCKFSAQKQCTVSINYLQEKTVIRFADNGIGIADEDLKNIFTAFYRGKNKSYTEGYGIGLSLCQKIIYLHKGDIYVSSKQREGSVFTIELPHI